MNYAPASWPAAAFVLIGTALALGSGAGCARTPSPVHPLPTSPSTPPQIASDPLVRVQTLARLADAYARTSNQLPGEDAREHRRLMASILAQLQEILPVLQGPKADAEFRQQLRVISDSQAELANGPQELPAEPTIDTALRAARDALSGIARGGIYDHADLTQLFQSLSSRIDELDTVRGPFHQLVAGEAVGLTSQIISKMADVMSQRLAEQNRSSQSASQSSPADAK